MKSLLLDIAKNSIKEDLIKASLIDKDILLQQYPQLDSTIATFVTLNIDNNLRGCIGSIVPHRTLLEDLIQNAKAAAFNDPRFLPLSLDEFERVDIEVSILSLPQEIVYSSIDDLKSKITIGIDGVIIIKDSYQATFLPQVWEQLDTFESFFAHLCQKAGLSSNCLEQKPTIYTYQVDKIS
jgi:AmmeMemoRadiSam system protein A